MTQKELGYIELEWTCKRCGTINPGMKRACTSCGAPMGAEDKYELPDQQELIEEKEKLEEAKKGPAVRCPYCNVFNPAGTTYCIQCGGDIQAGLARQAGEVLGAHSSAAVADKPCPFCNQPVKANAQRCPHCGGSLVEAEKPAPAPTRAQAKKMPLWLIIAGILLGVACIASVIGLAVVGNRTNDVTAQVADLRWNMSIDVLSQQPVEKSDWRDQVPAQAQDIACKDEYKETSSVPAPKSTEVCGTPYVIDQGSGAGKVVQDCEYRVYDSYCTYSILEWVVVDNVAAQGSDNQPQWPVLSLQSGQQEGDRHESYEVIFSGEGETYTYTPSDLAEFSQFSLDSQWILAINPFGQIKDIRSK